MVNNNSFRRATNLGSFSSAQVLRSPQETLGSSDKVDVFKFTLAPTLAFRTSASFNSKGGNLRVSTFVQNPLTNQFVPTTNPFVLKAGRSNLPFDFQATSVPLTFFVRFDKPTKDIKYRFTLKPIL
jgi:hypothetical protein